MARLSVFVTAVVGALLAAMARAAPAATVNTTPDLCNHAVCMGLALIHSTNCIKDIDIGPLTPDGLLGATTEVAQCVCADPKTKKSYLDCYGFCTLDPATEPFCNQPVMDDGADDDGTNELLARDNWKFKPLPPPKCEGPNCDKYDGSMAGMVGFCGVPGQGCSKVIDASEDTAGEVVEPEKPATTASAELQNAADIVERAPDRTVTISNWHNFCGVPGQGCAKVALPTADAGSNFIDVGETQSEDLEGRLGSGGKRAAAVAALVPTTLRVVKS